MPTCSECGSPVASALPSCPDCGAPIADTLPTVTTTTGQSDPHATTTTGTWSTGFGSSQPEPTSTARGVRLSIRSRPVVLRALDTSQRGLRYSAAPRHNAAVALASVRHPIASSTAPPDPQAAARQASTAPVVPLRLDSEVAPRVEREPAANVVTALAATSAPVDTYANHASEPPPPPRAVDTGSRLTPAAQSAARPPVLASEALRKDLAPPTPGQASARAVCAFVGLAGLGTALLIGRARGLGIPVGGAFAALSVLGLVPLAYAARAAAIVTVAGSGLAVVTWNRLESGVPLEPLVPLIGAMLLATALLFRSWHRASLLARALVALGIALCAGWVWMSGALPRVLVLEGAWQAWLPSLLVVPLAIMLLVSLLAFMDSRSTAGCAVWSALVLGWYALFVWSELLERAWPATAPGLDPARVSPELGIALVSGPLFAIALVVGLAQLLAVATATEHE
jgi:hypothetical protein